MEILETNVERIKGSKPHVVFWLLFIIYEVVFSYSVTGKFSSPVDYLTFYTLNIALFYVHAYIILQNSNGNKLDVYNIIAYAIIEIVFYLAIKYLITILYLWAGIYKTPNPPLLTYVRNSSWRAIYFIGLSSAYAYSRQAIRSRRKISEMDKQHFQYQLQKQQLEKEVLAYEVSFLKAQINPHFIFNMLSLIHNVISKDSEVAGDMIISISELMRYALMEVSSDGKVQLSQEIEHIENYINLNRHRYDRKLYLDFSVSGKVEQIKIIPLVLLTIVENIMKYGDLWDISRPAIVELTLSGHNLCFQVNNTKIKTTNISSTKIGMSNVVRRLDRFYPDNYNIYIDQDDVNYQLVLNLKIPPNDMLYN